MTDICKAAGRGCGTTTGWRNGGRCPRCREAHNAECRRYRHRKTALPPEKLDALRAAVTAGADLTETARELGVHPRTAHAHLASVLDMPGVPSRAELLAHLLHLASPGHSLAWKASPKTAAAWASEPAYRALEDELRDRGAPEPAPAAAKPAPPPVHRITADHIEDLLRRIFDPNRTIPLILISTSPSSGDRPLISPDALASTLAGTAGIAVFRDQDAAWAFSKRAPQAINTYGGAVRVLRPGATPDDPHSRHPLITIDPYRIDQAVQQIADHARGGSSQTTQEAADRALADADALARENADLRVKLETAKQSAKKVAEEKRQLAARLRRVKDGAGDAPPPLVYSDPARQAAYEIEQVWLCAYSEADRDARPLRPHAIGSEWPESVDRINLPRRLVLETAVDVLTGRAVENSARRVRPHHTGPVSGAPQLVRDDGATAWRCNVKTNSPGAPRLMWWVLRDGTIELGRIAGHDDNRLR